MVLVMLLCPGKEIHISKTKQYITGLINIQFDKVTARYFHRLIPI